jgi:hypothetical protein
MKTRTKTADDDRQSHMRVRGGRASNERTGIVELLYDDTMYNVRVPASWLQLGLR